MKIRHLWFVLVLSALSGLRAADLNSMMQDLQRVSTSADSIDMVLWMPTEFWDAALQQDDSVSAADRAEFLGNLGDITIFAVISGRMNTDGTVRTRSRKQILGTFDLKVEGRSLTPLDEEDLTEDAQNLVNLMKPMISNMLGALGEGMEFVVFRKVDDDGRAMLDPMQPGAFEISLRGEKYHWRLPLGSMLPPRYDPESGEKFPGNYRFSPFTGKELVERAGSGEP